MTVSTHFSRMMDTLHKTSPRVHHDLYRWAKQGESYHFVRYLDNMGLFRAFRLLLIPVFSKQ